MYWRIAGTGVAAAVIGFVAGAATMGSYVDTQGGGVEHPDTPAPPAEQACRVVVNNPAADPLPGVPQIRHLSGIAVDTLGRATGIGRCDTTKPAG